MPKELIVHKVAEGSIAQGIEFQRPFQRSLGLIMSTTSAIFFKHSRLLDLWTKK